MALPPFSSTVRWIPGLFQSDNEQLFSPLSSLFFEIVNPLSLFNAPQLSLRPISRYLLLFSSVPRTLFLRLVLVP